MIFWLAAIFFLGRGLIALVCRGVKFVIERRRAKATEEQKKRLNTAYTLLTSIARYVIYFCMLAAMLGVLGLGNAMNTLLASVGIGGLAIGIGAQTLINDIVTGFFLLFEDQLSVGDYVKVGQACGIVEEISLRTTSIRGFQGELFVIPNGQVTMLTSYSRGDYTVYIDVPVERGADQWKDFIENARLIARQERHLMDSIVHIKAENALQRKELCFSFFLFSSIIFSASLSMFATVIESAFFTSLSPPFPVLNIA